MVDLSQVMPGNIFKPWEPQQRDFIVDCRDPSKQFICAFCGLQGGKSIAGAEACYELLYGPGCIQLPEHLRGRTPAEFWIMSKSHHLADVALNTFKMITPPELWMSAREVRAQGLYRHDSRTHWLQPRDKSVSPEDRLPICVKVRTTSDPESMRATFALLLGWADECAHWKEMSWKNMLGRAIVAKSKFIVTTTPRGKTWAYRDLYVPGHSGADKSIGVHAWRSIDNPYADKAYLEMMRRKLGPDYAAQELDGMFVDSVGYVYSFDRESHTKHLPSQNYNHYPVRVVGIDPGYGDPYAAVLCLRDAEHRWWIADEMYIPSKATFSDAYPKLSVWLKHWKVQRMYCDKRRPTDYIELGKMGLPCVPNIDVFGEEDRRTIMPMVRIVQRCFREDRLKIEPHCEWMIEELENYAFKSQEDRNRGENPVDYRNHLADGLRYAISSVESLPEDRQPRYRAGPRGVPFKKKLDGSDHPADTKMTAAECLHAQEVAFLEERSKPKSRKDRYTRSKEK